jgi:hypothetical protein
MPDAGFGQTLHRCRKAMVRFLRREEDKPSAM